MKTYGGSGYIDHVFLISVVVRCEWWASRPGRFTSGEIGPWYPLARTTTRRREKPCPWRDSNSDSSAFQLAASRYPGSILCTRTLLILIRDIAKLTYHRTVIEIRYSVVIKNLNTCVSGVFTKWHKKLESLSSCIFITLLVLPGLWLTENNLS
jgi:hypothetical protein